MLWHVLPLYYPIENLIGQGHGTAGGIGLNPLRMFYDIEESIDGIKWQSWLLPICPNAIGGILLVCFGTFRGRFCSVEWQQIAD